MARPATLNVKIVADATAAAGEFDKTTTAMRGTERAARDVSGGIDSAGGASQKAAGGLRDMMGALEGTKFEAFGATVSKASTYFEAAAGASDLYAASSTAASGATKAWTIIQGAFNAVMALNPVALVVIAVVALGAALVVAYTKSETFRRIVDGAFQAVKTAVQAVVDILQGPMQTVWSGIKTAVDIYFTPIQALWEGLKGVIDVIIALLKGDFDGALEALKRTFDRVFDQMMAPIRLVRDGIGWIIDKVKDLLDLLPSIKIPSLPDWIPNPFAASAAAPAVAGTRTTLPAARTGGSMRAAGGGGIVVNLSVPATANPVETGRQIVSMIRRFERAAGPAWRT